MSPRQQTSLTPFSPLGSRTPLPLDIAFGLRQEGLARKLEFVGLGIHANEFDVDLVPLLEPGLLHGLETLVVDFGDVEQRILSGHDLDKRTECHDRTDLSVVGFAHLRDGGNGLDPGQSPVEGLLVDTEDVDDTLVVDLCDGDGGVGCLLDVLDHLSAGADYRADHILRDGDLYDTRHAGFVVRPRFGDALGDLSEDVHTSLSSLLECRSEDFVGESVDLDVHLRGGDTVLGTGHLEVHVTEVVLISEDVGEHGPLAGCGVGDQSHGDTRDGFLDLHAGIHQGEGSGADGGHRRGAV